MKYLAHTKQDDEIKRINRRRRLDQLLRTVGLHSQKDFAAEYDVDVRTIFNDLEWLSSKAGDIKKQGRSRFYVDTDCPSPFHLTESQTMAFLLGHTALCQYGGPAFESEAKDLMYKIFSEVLDSDLKSRISDLSDAISFSRQHAVMYFDRSILHDMIKAYLERKTIEISYITPGFTCSNRVIHPYTFLNNSGEWALLAFCELRKKVRQFKIHRIQEVVIKSDPYVIPVSYDSIDELSNGFDNYCDGKTYHFEIEFSGKTRPHIDSHFHHITQVFTNLDNGNCLLKFTSEGLPAVARWVMKYGSGATVHQPQELIDHITNEIEQMQSNYRKG